MGDAKYRIIIKFYDTYTWEEIQAIAARIGQDFGYNIVAEEANEEPVKD